MEFKSLKNIETEFRQIRLFTLVFLALCAAVPLCAVWMSFRYAEAQREKIYVLDQASLMLALSRISGKTGPSKPASMCAAFTSSSSPTVPKSRRSKATSTA